MEMYDHPLREGIGRFAGEHRWIITVNDGCTLPDGWQGDGIITYFDTRRDIINYVTHVNIPVVNLSGFRPDIPFPCVTGDNVGIGRMAADFFMGKRLTSFAYVAALREGPWDTERRAAFRKRLGQAGFAPAEYISETQHDWEEESQRLAGFLKGLPKPCGIFASFDQRAKHVLDVCRTAGIAVPDQVQILGVDNEEWVCETTRPTLSSIELDFRLGGYLAAKRLDDLLGGRRLASRYIRYKPACIIERTSTSDHLGSSRSVAAAMDFIRVNALEEITVSDIAKASRTSLRMLQKNFARAKGLGIAEALRNERLRQAKIMLETTETPIATITERCRLGGEFSAKTLFRRHFGMTMREYRKRHAETPGHPRQEVSICRG